MSIAAPPTDAETIPSPATLKAAPTDDIPEHLRPFISPPGIVTPYWKPELTPEGWQQVQQLLAEIEGKR